MLQITEEKIKGLYEIYDKLNKQKELASELLRTAKDRYSHRKVKVKKEDGTDTTVTEKILWEEVFYLGMGNNRATIELEKRHPQVFKAYREQEELAKSCNNYVLASFGMESERVTMADIFQITEAMVRYMLSGRDLKISKKGWFEKLLGR